MFESSAAPAHRIKAPIRYTAALLAAYFVAWTVSYVVVMYNAVLRLDFGEYFHWFLLAWTFQGLEMVEITWLLSIALFFPLAFAGLWLARRTGGGNAAGAADGNKRTSPK